MPIVVNSNVTATTASFNLSHANNALRKSLARLSSGNRIVNPADDAGGMAVAYKLDSTLKRTEAVRQNIQNGISYLQVQDGALKITGNILSRMSELRTMAADITKNSSDVENYSKEFIELQSQLRQIKNQKFNGISLFAINGHGAADFAPDDQIVKIGSGTFNYTMEDDSTENYEYDKYAFHLNTAASGLEEDGHISLNVINLEFVLSIAGRNGTADYNLGGFDNDSTGAISTVALNGENFIENITDVSMFSFTLAIEKLADLRAENGAEQNRLTMAGDLLALNQTNLEAAHGRIMYADIALESTRFARQNVLVQASAAMVAQANQLTNVALTVLG